MLPPHSCYLQGRTVDFLGRSWWWNPGIAARLASMVPSVAVITGLGSWTSLAVLAWSWRSRVPVILWDESCSVGLGIESEETRLGDIPNSAWSAAHDTGKEVRRENHAERLLKAILAARCSAVMVPGRAAAEYQRRVIGVKDDRLFLVGDPVDNAAFASTVHSAEETRQRWGVGNDTTVFLYVGHLSRQKGVDRLLEAFDTLRSSVRAKLVLAGTGELADLASRRADVILLGFVGPVDLPAVYAGADAFVFPTLHDVWGLVVNEAMAAGLPVVCSHFAGCAADLVDDSNGILIDPRVTHDIVRAMRTMVDAPTRRQMGQASLSRVASMSIDRTARLMLRTMLFVARGDHHA